MATVVEICNMALQALGAARISDIAGSSTEARACNLCYGPLRQAELRDHPWSCALTRARLAADATDPEWGRAKSYELPADFLALAPDYPEDRSIERDLQIEGSKILSDESAPLEIRYVRDLTDPNKMDPLFRLALAYRMAHHMAEQLTQSNTKKESAWEAYQEVIKRARRANAIERPPQTSPDAEWITRRL